MLIKKISTYLLIILLAVLFVVQGLTQHRSSHRLKKIKPGRNGSMQVPVEVDVEPDTAFVVPGFKSDSMQQVVLQRKLIGDTFHKIKSGDDFWYTRIVKKGTQKSNFSFLNWVTKILSGTTARFVVWCILIGGIVFFFVLYLVNNEIGIFAPAKRKRVEIKNTDGLPDNIFEIDYETALAGSLASGNYRLSTRLLFLRVLKIMNERKLIEYSIEKTNLDYLFQLNGTDYLNNFSTLIKSYEYTWYGEFTISEQQYALIDKNFSQFQQQINQLN